jgi:hypothetical protein
MFAITNQVASAADGGGAQAPKMVCFSNDFPANIVIYTVPKGRKWVGRIGNTTNNWRTQINGVSIYAYHGGSTSVVQSAALGEMTLIAGTVIKEGNANGSYIWGVESDL